MRRNYIRYCVKSECERIYDRHYVCPKCGECVDSIPIAHEEAFIEGIWLKSSKSVHRRDRWFSKTAIQYAGSDTDTLTDDFKKVVHCMGDHRLIKGKNVSRCGYYIIRLASRRNIRLLTKPKDMMPYSPIKGYFDDRLFGKVYPLLGWDENCNCPCCLEWRKKVRQPL